MSSRAQPLPFIAPACRSDALRHRARLGRAPGFIPPCVQALRREAKCVPASTCRHVRGPGARALSSACSRLPASWRSSARFPSRTPAAPAKSERSSPARPPTGPPICAPRKNKHRMPPRGSPNTTRYRASCTECGTIASVREIPAWRDVGWRERVDVKGHPRDAGITSTIAIDKAPASERIYEVTVRFRDGTTTVFNESGAPTWRVGNHVIVIAGADPSRIDTRPTRSAADVKTAANDR